MIHMRKTRLYSSNKDSSPSMLFFLFFFFFSEVWMNREDSYNWTYLIWDWGYTSEPSRVFKWIRIERRAHYSPSFIDEKFLSYLKKKEIINQFMYLFLSINRYQKELSENSDIFRCWKWLFPNSINCYD